MSPEVYRRNYANLEIDSRLKKDGPLEKVFKEALEDEDKKVLAFREKQRALIRDKNPGKPMMEINRSSRACLETRRDDKYFKQYEEDLFRRAKQESSKFYANRDPLLLLELDNYLRGPRLQSRTLPAPSARFALEGEGIGTYMIQKSFRPGELIHGGLPSGPEAGSQKVSTEASPVNELMDMMFGKKPNNPERKKQLCAEIRDLSRASLSQVKGASQSQPGAR